MLSKEVILAINNELLSDGDKKYLIEKLYPKVPLSNFQYQLNQYRLKEFESKRWESYLRDGIQESDLNSYRFKHHDLMFMGQRNTSPIIFKGRVTDFTNWIFSIYQTKSSEKSLVDGKEGERKVAALMTSVPSNKNWELIYKDSLDGISDVKNITSLVVRGQNLRGIPDLVFREKNTGRIIIVERKTSNKEIPSDGWPNLKAQLWAYSKIDEWANAPEIILIGEVWGFDGNRDVYPRHVYRWSASDKNFERENRNLFNLFCTVVC